MTQLSPIIPRISVIIPVYNRAFCISDTVESVMNQSYKNIELIVVDDGSTDESFEIVSIFASINKNILTLKQENSGACAARNNGLSIASGDYILFLDSDDMLQSNHVASYVELITYNHGCCIYGPWSAYTFKDGTYEQRYTRGQCESDDLLTEWIKGGWWISPCCILWPRNVLVNLGGWDESLAANQDGDMAMRALVDGIKFIYCSKALPAKIIHYPGKHNISREKSLRTLRSRQKTLVKIEKLMIKSGMFNRKYKNLLAIEYYNRAYNNLYNFPDFADECYADYRKLNGYLKPPGTFLNWIFTLLLGLRKKEKLSAYISKLTKG